MIYSKDAAFPYPILTNQSSDYTDGYFNLGIEGIYDESEYFRIKFQYELESEFLNRLLAEEQAVLLLIISSKDHHFFELEGNQREITMSKTRLSLANQTNLQLQIQSTQPIDFSHNDELNDFYKEIRSELTLHRKSLLAYSNVQTVRNTGKKGFDLFEYSVDPKANLDFQIELTEQSILLIFKDSKFLLTQLGRGRDLLNLYLYIGLEKALLQFFEEQMNYTNGEAEDVVYLDDIEPSNLNNLHLSLLELMLGKGIEELVKEELDNVIQSIAPGIIQKYTKAIERIYDDGN